MRFGTCLAVFWLAACGSSVGGRPGTADEDAGGDTGGDTSLPGDGLEDGDPGSSDGDSQLPPPTADALTCPNGSTASGPAPNGVVPGALSAPFPTLRNATLVWSMDGDADHDSVVDVRFRVSGTGTWRAAMPLFYVLADSAEGFSWETRHTGSIFDLEPGTNYEVQARMSDPDGGCRVATIGFTTRSTPDTSSVANKTATPGTLASVLAGLTPGDIVDVAAGAYAGFSVPTSGTASSPVVLRAAGDAVINGDVSLIGRAHVAFTGFTVNGRVRINGTTGVTITRNTINTGGDGIVAATRSETAYIADNIVSGATVWQESALGVSGANIGEGIAVTGPGHVIEHNRVSGFRDCISFFEDAEAEDQYSLDVVENELDNCADDGIEADFCAHNCRMVRNRMTNVFMGMSSQPSLGGPTYFVRNVAYNVVLSTFKLQRGSIGDVVLHNTSVKNGDALGIYTSDVFARQLFRNNLFIGGPGGSYNGFSNGDGDVMALAAADASGDYDYDAFGSTTGAFSGRLGATTFASLAAMRAGTTEEHAVRVDLSAFAVSIDYPSSPFPARAVPDLRLAATSDAIDAGIPLANINDTAPLPDCGAYERGSALPAYGPR